MKLPNSFIKHLLTLLSGTAVGQLIVIASTPWITRLYSPSEFAVASAFIGISTMLGIFATLRYELAIMLPKDDIDAKNLMVLSGGILCAMLIIVYIGLTFIGGDILNYFESYQKIRNVLYLLLPMMLSLGGVQILNAWANRSKEYSGMAISNIAGQGGNAILSILFGVIGISGNGLVFGRVLGQIIGTLTLFSRVRKTLSDLSFNNRQLTYVAKRYKQFPLFNVPYSVIGVLSQELLILFLIAYHFGEVAGYFALVRTVLLMPARYLSSSLGVVFFREASQLVGTMELENLTLKIMWRLVYLSLPVLIVLFLWSGPVFSFIFGQSWENAGLIAVCYIPVAFLFLLTSWPERLYEITDKQNISLGIEIIGNILKFSIVFLLLSHHYSPIDTIAAYVIVDVIYHLAYLLGIFYVGGFRYSKLIRLISGSVIFAIILFALFKSVQFVTAKIHFQVYATALLLGLVLTCVTIAIFKGKA